jgi:hypothetical protein
MRIYHDITSLSASKGRGDNIFNLIKIRNQKSAAFIFGLKYSPLLLTALSIVIVISEDVMEL